MKKNSFSNNSELNEILIRPNNFIIRYGITIISSVIIIAFYFSFFIVVPHIIVARIQKIKQSTTNNLEIINVIVPVHNIDQLSRFAQVELSTDKNKRIKGVIKDIFIDSNNRSEYKVVIYITDRIIIDEMKDVNDVYIIAKYDKIGELLFSPIRHLF